jgi:hypothetical protein
MSQAFGLIDQEQHQHRTGQGVAAVADDRRIVSAVVPGVRK